MKTRTELARQLAGVAESHGVADLYVFGSRTAEVAARVRGMPRPLAPTGSDVDIGVRPKSGRLAHVDARVALALALEDLLGVPRVDLYEICTHKLGDIERVRNALREWIASRPDLMTDIDAG